MKKLAFAVSTIGIVAALAVFGIAHAADSEPTTHVAVGGPLNAAVVGDVAIPGIRGDRTDGGIDIRSFKVGVTTTLFREGGGGTTTSRGKYGDFNVVKEIDSATPQILLTAATGKRIPEVTVTARRVDPANPGVTMTYKLTDVLVVGVQNHDGGTAGGSPLEEVTFNFSKIEQSFTKSDGTVVATSFDVRTGK